MGNKIKHLLEGFKYQEIATIYCILKYINEKDLEIYIEKQNEEDAQVILDKKHIIDLQFKNKIGKQITIEEFCKWLSNFEGNKLDIHLLKKLVEDKNRKIIFMTSGRCKDDTYIFTDKGKKNLTKKDLTKIKEKLKKVKADGVKLKEEREKFQKGYIENLEDNDLKEALSRVEIQENFDEERLKDEITKLFQKNFYISKNSIDLAVGEMKKLMFENFGNDNSITDEIIAIIDKYRENKISNPEHIKRKEESRCIDILEENKILLLTGVTYCGKTELAKEIAQEYRDKNYKTIIDSNIEKIFSFGINDRKIQNKLLILEDPFGNVEVSTNKNNILSKFRELVNEVSKMNNRKLIVTTRKDILFETMKKNKIEDCKINKYEWIDLTNKNSDEVKKLWKLHTNNSIEMEEMYNKISRELNKKEKNLQFGHITNIFNSIEKEELKEKSLEEIVKMAMIDSETIAGIIRERGDLAIEFFIKLGMICNTNKSISKKRLKNILNTKNDIENYKKKLKKFLNLESNINDEWDSEYQKEFDYLKKRGLIKEDYNGEITFTHPIYHYASYMLLEEEYRETKEKKELLIVKIERLLYFPFSDMNLCTLDFIEKLYEKTLDKELKSIILNGLDDIFPSVKAEIITFFSNNFMDLSLREKENFVYLVSRSKKIYWNKGIAYYDLNGSFLSWNVHVPQQNNIDNKNLNDIISSEKIFSLINKPQVSLETLEKALEYDEIFIRSMAIGKIFEKYAYSLNKIDKYLLNYEHPDYIYSLFINVINNWEKYNSEFKDKIKNYIFKNLSNIVLLLRMEYFLSNFSWKKLDLEECLKKELWEIWFEVSEFYFDNCSFEYATMNNITLTKDAIFSLDYITEEKKVIEFAEKWLGWLEQFEIPNTEEFYDFLEKSKEFAEPYKHHFGVMIYLLEGIEKKDECRKELFQKILKTKSTFILTVNIWVAVNRWNDLYDDEKNMILNLLKSDRNDVKWIKAISLNIDNIPNEIQKEVLGIEINQNIPEIVDKLIEENILEECLNIYCGYSQPLYWMGYHHQNSELWDEVILEVLKRDQLNKSYEIALREFIDWINKGEKENIENLLKIYSFEILNENTEKIKQVFREISYITVIKGIKIELLNGNMIIWCGNILWEIFFNFIKNKSLIEYKKYLNNIVDEIELFERYQFIDKLFDKEVFNEILDRLNNDKLIIKKCSKLSLENLTKKEKKEFLEEIIGIYKHQSVRLRKSNFDLENFIYKKFEKSDNDENQNYLLELIKENEYKIYDEAQCIKKYNRFYKLKNWNS